MEDKELNEKIEAIKKKYDDMFSMSTIVELPTDIGYISIRKDEDGIKIWVLENNDCPCCDQTLFDNPNYYQEDYDKYGKYLE